MMWLDAQLSPRVAHWIREVLGHDAEALRDVGLRDAEDQEIFDRGKQGDVIILTKDKDFVDLVGRLGSPPAVIWLRCGNTSEARLKQILTDHLDVALEFIGSGDDLVEIQ
jgi:predicted nuclease of predicted toxin-antitoxin system